MADFTLMKICKIIFLLIIMSMMVLLIAQPYRISGDCMEPAIMDGHLYFLNRLSPYLRQPKIDDIILFKHNGKIWISRIVALGSDKILISNSSIMVNSVVRDNSDIHRNWSNWKYGIYAINSTFQVATNHVFVLSDNLSAHHDDSRVFGSIATKSILGVIW